jgi:hypothetical protein
MAAGESHWQQRCHNAFHLERKEDTRTPIYSARASRPLGQATRPSARDVILEQSTGKRQRPERANDHIASYRSYQGATLI